MSPSRHCPRCGSDRITGRKERLFEPVRYEYYCANCSLAEERTADAPGLAEWQRRWETPPAVKLPKLTPAEWRAHLDEDARKRRR